MRPIKHFFIRSKYNSLFLSSSDYLFRGLRTGSIFRCRRPIVHAVDYLKFWSHQGEVIHKLILDGSTCGLGLAPSI